MRVPLVDLAAQEASVADEVLAAIARVVQEGTFIGGARVEEFEKWLARSCGVAWAVGLASGSDALELGLRALGIGAGDAVVTPSLSFIAAAEAVAAVGAHPVFCDVDERTMNADAIAFESAVHRARRSGLRVRALIAVHLFGRCAPLGELRDLAGREGLELVEDAAQALGARDEAGLRAGGVGDVGCFSFFPTKPLGAWGDGGALVTPREEVATRVRRLRAHGAVERYVHAEPGRNSRLDALQAAALLVKASRLEAWRRARGELVSRYRSRLADLPIELPQEPRPPAVHAWHAFVIRSERRDALERRLRDVGVESRAYYPLPLHRQPCFASLEKAALPVADAICRTALALPLYAAMRPEQLDHVAREIERFYGRS